MVTLPPAYAWLGSEHGPRMLDEAKKLFGVCESMGAVDNPTILAWADEVGLASAYKHDSIAWCGLFMAVVAKRARKQVPPGPLWALNWVKFGEPVNVPMLGDVLTFKRKGGGHVAIYVGEDDTAFHVIGGNQSDQVSITRIRKTRLHAIRRPTYRVQPKNVRQLFLKGDGALSENEI